jgi:hypothetical protein
MAYTFTSKCSSLNLVIGDKRQNTALLVKENAETDAEIFFLKFLGTC